MIPVAWRRGGREEGAREGGREGGSEGGGREGGRKQGGREGAREGGSEGGREEGGREGGESFPLGPLPHTPPTLQFLTPSLIASLPLSLPPSRPTCTYLDEVWEVKRWFLNPSLTLKVFPLEAPVTWNGGSVACGL